MAKKFNDLILPPPKRTGDDTRDLVQLIDWAKDLHSAVTDTLAAAASTAATAKARKAYYANRAALLDPRAMVYLHPPFYATVPEGEAWFLMNAFFCDAFLRNGTRATNSNGDYAHFEHRNPHYENALPIGPGTTLAQFVHYGYTNAVGAASYCNPKLVWQIDPRYQDDPEALYYERLEKLHRIEVRKTWARIPQGSPAGSIAYEKLDWSGSDADYGILRHTSTSDAAWVDFAGTTEDDFTRRTLALLDEISDHRSHRFGWPTIVPFTRKRPGIQGFDTIELKGGNQPGDLVTPTGNDWSSGVDGFGIVTWSALPADW